MEHQPTASRLTLRVVLTPDGFVPRFADCGCCRGRSGRPDVHPDWSVFGYSDRSTRDGAIRDTRQAGMIVATMATLTTSAVAAPRIAGSAARTS